MNKNYKTDCSEFLPELNYKPCSEYKEMNKKTLKSNMRKYVKSNMKYKPILDYNNRTCKQHQKYKRLINKCLKYTKTTKNKKCKLDEYIKFSGAEIM
jgi:hypothetical protein